MLSIIRLCAYRWKEGWLRCWFGTVCKLTFWSWLELYHNFRATTATARPMTAISCSSSS